MADTAVAPKPEVVAPLMDPAFIAECFGATTPEAAPKSEASVPVVTPTADDKTSTDTPAAEVKKTEPVAAPVADPVVEDLSDVAEILHAPLRAMDAEKRAVALKELRKGYLRQKDYTAKTTGIADIEKSAAAFDLAMKNPALRKAWNDIMANPTAEQAPDASEDQEAENLAKLALEADGKGLQAVLKKLKADAVAEAKAEFDKLYEKRAIEPGQKFKAVESALEAQIAETGLAPEVVREAVRKALKYPGNGPIESWDPSKAWGLIEPFLAPTNTPAPSAAKPPIPKVAPPGRGASASAPASLPAHRREGRPPKNNSEEASEFATLLSEALGREISVADLDHVS